MLRKKPRVHFVGIGGIGMSGIAELLKKAGYDISGSDEKESAITERLTTLGVRISYFHAERNLDMADIVVRSSAIPDANPEIGGALARGIPVIGRADMLAELMRLKKSIAVAGAHGKTTTTSMIAFVLERNGFDPTAVIGGRLRAFDSNARSGDGEWMVVEADESDRSFLRLSPTTAVITNIDDEHLENYDGDVAKLQRAFVEFANKVSLLEGAVVACADDERLAALTGKMKGRLITYGVDALGADYEATDIVLGQFGARATVMTRVPASGEPARPRLLGTLELLVPGRHNVQNAMAAVAVGSDLGIPFGDIARALGVFRGADRRFDVRGEVKGILVIDDYGHHPTEIAAVLAAARELHRPILAVFQPHRFTRTARLLDRFGPALSAADRIILTDIYSAGEDPISGVNADVLKEAIERGARKPVTLVRRLDDLIPEIVNAARPGDAVITLGAGSIGSVPDKLIQALSGTLFPTETRQGNLQ